MSRDWRLRIEDILEACERIREYIRDADFEDFNADPNTIDAVVRQFEIIGESVKTLPDEIRSREPDIPWRQIAGFRDVLIHAYIGVDHSTVWDAATSKLPDLRGACHRLLNTEL
jgi:uncharacterized protein with HEPN domain